MVLLDLVLAPHLPHDQLGVADQLELGGAELARELYDPAALSAAAIAPDEDRFRSALAPVSEQLAAA